MIGRLILFALVAALIAAFIMPIFRARPPEDDETGDANDRVRSLEDHRRSKKDD